jgi:hypothetical protein
MLKLAQMSDEPIESVLSSLKECEHALAAAQAELDAFLDSTATSRDEVEPERIKQKLREHSERLLELNREAGALLERLIPDKIKAIPYRQFGSNKIVLRAEFELRLANLLPARLLDALKGAQLDSAEWAKPIPMLVDLFEPSLTPLHAVKAAQRRATMTLDQIGKDLIISKRAAHLASQLGLEMLAAGISDPFIRLDSPPENASRWRPHAKFLLGDDQREAG